MEEGLAAGFVGVPSVDLELLRRLLRKLGGELEVLSGLWVASQRGEVFVDDLQRRLLYSPHEARRLARSPCLNQFINTLLLLNIPSFPPPRKTSVLSRLLCARRSRHGGAERRQCGTCMAIGQVERKHTKSDGCRPAFDLSSSSVLVTTISQPEGQRSFSGSKIESDNCYRINEE